MFLGAVLLASRCFLSQGSCPKLVMFMRRWAPCDLRAPHRSWTRLLLAGCSLTVAPTVQSLSLQEQPCWEAALGGAECQLPQNLPSRHQYHSVFLEVCGGGIAVGWALAATLSLGHPPPPGSGPVGPAAQGAQGREASRGPLCMSGLWDGPGVCSNLGKAV